MLGAAWFAVAVGVANKVQPMSDMVLTDAASRQNRRPDFVTQCFHVIADAIKPVAGFGNLFTKQDSRTTFSDEP